MSTPIRLSSVEVTSTEAPWTLECRFANPAGETVPPPDGITAANIALTRAPSGEAPFTVESVVVGNGALTIRLVDHGSPPPPGVQRPPYAVAVEGLAMVTGDRVAFVVGAETPAVDCSPSTPPPREVLPDAVPVDLRARDYEALRTLMLDQIARRVPTWDETNPADLLVTLVEALAYSGDLLSYHQDAVATEAYLTTARRQLSLKRHARLVDYRVSPGVDARVWVAFEVSSAGWIDVGTPLATRGNGLDSTVVTAGALRQARQSGAVLEFLTAERLSVSPDRNGIDLVDPDGPPEQVLVTGTTTVAIPAAAAIGVGEVVIFEELVNPVTGSSADADPRRRQAVRITSAVTSGDRLTLTWSEADALRNDFWVRTVTAGVVRDGISVLRGNVVLAMHARPVHPDLDPATVPSGEPFRPALTLTDLTWNGPLPSPELPAAGALVQDPANAWPQLRLTDSEGRAWIARKDLLESGPFERHFVVDRGEDGGLQLRFGDGHLGARPAVGLAFTAEGLAGNGPVGNVGADAIAHIVWPLRASPAIQRCWNPLPGAGGRDTEGMARVRMAAPHAYREPLRAVTATDWTALAEGLAEVRAATAEASVTGLQTAFLVHVDLYQDDDTQLERVTSLLEPFRLVGNQVKVVRATYLAVEVVLVVWIEPQAAAATVRSELEKRFGTGSFQQQPAFFAPGQHGFGDAVYLSPILEGASATLGVAWIDADPSSDPRVRFQAVGAPTSSTARNVRQGYIPVPDDAIAVTTTGSDGRTGSVRFVIVEVS